MVLTQRSLTDFGFGVKMPSTRAGIAKEAQDLDLALQRSLEPTQQQSGNHKAETRKAGRTSTRRGAGSKEKNQKKSRAAQSKVKVQKYAEPDSDWEPSTVDQRAATRYVVHQTQHLTELVNDERQKILSGRVTKVSEVVQDRKTRHAKIVAQKGIQTVARELRLQENVQKPVHRTKQLRVKLTNINFSALSQAIRDQDYRLVQYRKKLENFTGLYLPPPPGQCDNTYGFAFDHNPFQHIGFRGPSHPEQWSVYNLMRDDLQKNFNKQCFLEQPDESTNEFQGGPMHMTDDLSIDNLVKVILSISTENSLAIRQHAQLCSKFTYTVHGKEVRGTVPNYHKMRTCSASELVGALNIAGQHNIRQKTFHAILNEVYEQNLKRQAEDATICDGNALNESEFVPGMLSMEYLKGKELSKQERFDLLVRFPQIAVKTGCCLLAFNLKIKVFVVDTHVHHMVRNLGWIPEDCLEADKACAFLDTIMEPDLKFGLHQAFWHHRINCVRCMPRANPKLPAYKDRICPLELLIKRNLPPLRKLVRSEDTNAKDPIPVAKRERNKNSRPKRLAGSVTFLNIYHKEAADKGYALRKIEIDDDFGEGSRQNKDKTASYYWGMKEFTHANDIVELDDALKDIGMTRKAYEARFARRRRVKKTKVTVEKTIETTKYDLSSDSELSDVPDDIDEMDIDEI